MYMLQAQQPDTSAFHQRQAESSTACSMQHSQPQPPSRAWCAPDLGPDIEEAHANAIRNGKPTYTDPATGYTVGTSCCPVSSACASHTAFRTMAN